MKSLAKAVYLKRLTNQLAMLDQAVLGARECLNLLGQKQALDEPDCEAMELAMETAQQALEDGYIAQSAMNALVNTLTEVSNMATNDYISNCDGGV